MSRISEQLSEQFRQWEERGRGWHVFDAPVAPEPAFQPFRGHFLPPTAPVDDGGGATAVSSFVGRLSQKLSGQPPLPPVIPEPEEEPEPEIFQREVLNELQASLPSSLNVSREEFQQFLLNLSLCQEPIAFELVGTPGKVVAQFSMHPSDLPLVRRQLQAHFPEAVFQKREGTLEETWATCQGDEIMVVEFGLAREFMLPLATGKLDPFVGIIGALSELQAGEFAMYQVLFTPVRQPWPESITRSVTYPSGSPFFVNRPELASGAKEKIQKPLFAAVVRIAFRSESCERMSQIGRDLAASLRVFANPQGNELIPLENSDYPFEEHIIDLLCRQSRRTGMLLNSDELIGFVHLPSSAVRSRALQRQTAKTKAAPASVRGSAGLPLGNNVHAEETCPVRLTPDQRVRHMHIVGASGTGKSTLLFNLIAHDIRSGEGLAVLDPHGDLVERILGIIPPERIGDVVLVDPSDEEFSVGFNILSAHSELEKNLLASDLVSVFQRLSTSWGDQLGSVLQNGILAMLESEHGGTLADLRRFLLEPAFREKFLKTVRDPDILYYWRKGFVQLSGNKSVGPVLTRLDTFLSPKPIRYMVSQQVNRLDFAHILDTGKIFLAKLPQGQMGKENSFLLGSLLVAKFQQLAMGRQAQRVTSRRDFWLYADEFQNFITPSMTEILTGARKYRLGLILAHQELRQLDRDREVASAVLSNPFTRVIFRVGDADARNLATGLSFFEARDLQNLETGQAICRVEKADGDFNLTIPLSEDPPSEQAEVMRQAVVNASRAKYATPKAEVEAASLEKLKWIEEAPLTAKAKSRPTPPPLPSESEKKTAEVREPTAPVLETILPAPKAQAAASIQAAEEDSQHDAIKKQIQREAESLDYTVNFEERVLDGPKRIDVVLQRGNQRIACEVSVTNTVEYEAAKNITKCLTAGFFHVAAICLNRNKLARIQARFAELVTPAQAAKVGFYTPAEFISKLFDWAAEDPAGGIAEKGKPRKRPIALNASQLSDEERRLREKEMLEALKRTMKRPGV